MTSFNVLFIKQQNSNSVKITKGMSECICREHIFKNICQSHFQLKELYLSNLVMNILQLKTNITFINQQK